MSGPPQPEERTDLRPALLALDFPNPVSLANHLSRSAYLSDISKLGLVYPSVSSSMVRPQNWQRASPVLPDPEPTRVSFATFHVSRSTFSPNIHQHRDFALAAFACHCSGVGPSRWQRAAHRLPLPEPTRSCCNNQDPSRSHRMASVPCVRVVILLSP